MKRMILVLGLIMLCFNVQASEETIEDTTAYILDLLQLQNYYDSIEKTFNYETGLIELGNIATIQVPEGYKFLNPTQSSFVLTELWGNPPTEGLGMLFPENTSPVSENFTYAVEITYEEEGYIKDDDAEDLDYDDLLEEMQDDSDEINKERIKQGYEKVDLVGWASEPFYDKENKKLHWAKELKFGDEKINTLNYNIRILGRKGFLNMNAIGEMVVLPDVQADIDNILASVDFTEGNRYADFNPDMDNIAVYGIGGLIAGKMLAKVGFFAIILKFWKIGMLAAVGLFSAFKKKLFGGGRGEEEVKDIS